MNENIAFHPCFTAAFWGFRLTLPPIDRALFPSSLVLYVLPSPNLICFIQARTWSITNSASLSTQDGSEEGIKIPKQGKSKRLVLLPLSLACLHIPAPCSVWSSAWFYLVFSVASLSQSSASYFLPLLSPKERWILNKFLSLSTTSFLVVCFGFCT